MKGLFGSSALVASLFMGKTNGDARATFGGTNGITGTVDVMDGGLSISLDISELMAMNYTGVPDGASCFTGGLKYHIHESWTYDDNTDRLEGDCGATYTGGHWDPWLGCGSATGNDYCTAQGGCVAGSTAYGDGGYDCSTSTFAENAYACEVGDWNGKYGLAMVDDSGMITISGSSSFEVSGDDIADVMSVVFHCNGGDRAFCAPFESSDDSGDERPTQADEDDAMVYGGIFYDDDAGNATGSVVFYPTGDFEVTIDVSGLACDDYALRIYNDWDSDDMSATGSDCDSIIGSFYDPTVSCAYGSDSEYCLGDDMTVCNSSNAYSCDYENDRFSCAPGDITGKFACDETLLAEGACVIEDNDDLMIDLNLLDGKSFVVQCADDYSVQLCAAVQSGPYNSTDMTTMDDDDDTMDDDDSGDDTGDDDDDAGDDDDSGDDADDDDDDDDDSGNRYGLFVAVSIAALMSLIL